MRGPRCHLGGAMGTSMALLLALIVAACGSASGSTPTARPASPSPRGSATPITTTEPGDPTLLPVPANIPFLQAPAPIQNEWRQYYATGAITVVPNSTVPFQRPRDAAGGERHQRSRRQHDGARMGRCAHARGCVGELGDHRRPAQPARQRRHQCTCRDGWCLSPVWRHRPDDHRQPMAIILALGQGHGFCSKLLERHGRLRLHRYVCGGVVSQCSLSGWPHRATAGPDSGSRRRWLRHRSSAGSTRLR